MLATAAENSIVATRITRRGPYLSSIGPIIGEHTPSSSVLTETAADTCVRPQPNSAASGLMKTVMLARNVGEMLNASPMMQDSRRTGAYPMCASLEAKSHVARSHATRQSAGCRKHEELLLHKFPLSRSASTCVGCARIGAAAHSEN